MVNVNGLRRKTTLRDKAQKAYAKCEFQKQQASSSDTDIICHLNLHYHIQRTHFEVVVCMGWEGISVSKLRIPLVAEATTAKTDRNR